LSNFNENIFPRQIFEKHSNIKFHENLSSWSRVVSCGQTDGHGKPNSRSSQFCERSLKKEGKEEEGKKGAKGKGN